MQRVETIGQRAAGTDLIVFPETTLSGFPTRDTIADVAEPIDGPSLTAVRNAAREARVAVAVGLAERDGSRFFNTTVLVDERGEIALRYRKTHLWASDVGVFEPGDRYEVCSFKGLDRWPAGLLRHRISGNGARRCLARRRSADRDQRQYGPVRAGASPRNRGACDGESDVRALVNRIGSGDDNLTFPGESALIDPLGDVVCDGSEETMLRAASIQRGWKPAREHYRYLHDARISLDLATLDGEKGTCAVIERAGVRARTSTLREHVKKESRRLPRTPQVDKTRRGASRPRRARPRKRRHRRPTSPRTRRAPAAPARI